MRKFLEWENGVMLYQFITLFMLFVVIVIDFIINKTVNEFLSGALIGLMFAPGKDDTK